MTAPPRFHRGALALWLALTGYLAAFAYQVRGYYVDDAYIALQYLQNLLHGQGMVFQAGQPPVEGVTAIGYLACLAPLAAWLGPPLAAKVLGFTLLCASLALLIELSVRIARADAQPRAAGFGWRVAPAVLVAWNFDYAYFPLAGLETALLAVLLLCLARLACQSDDAWPMPLLAAAAFLVHPEAVAVYPAYCVLRWRARRDRRVPRRMAILAALVGAITLTRWFYFHDVVPNTFHSKPSGLWAIAEHVSQMLAGRNVNVPFPLSGWLALPLLALGYARLRRVLPAPADMLGATVGVGLAFAAYSPPDWTQTARYFAPYLPAAMLLFWGGVLELLRRALPRPGQLPLRLATAWGLCAVLLGVLSLDRLGKLGRMQLFPGHVMASKELVGPALWMREHLAPGATIATRRIGVVAYFTQRPVFDYMYGLPDREVARLVQRAGRPLDNPNDPALAELWRRRAPQYVLEDEDTMEMFIALAHGRRERFAIHGIEYGVLRTFPLGRDTRWTLAQRLPPAGGPEVSWTRTGMSKVEIQTPQE